MATGMERLRFMQGEWDVEAYLADGEGQWLATPLPNETSIIPIFGGKFHQEDMVIATGEVITRQFYSWSYDSYRQVYRMVSCDRNTGLMDILEGNFEPDSDTVTITDIRSGTTVLEADGSSSYIRLSSTKNHQDSFTDIVSESRDGGETWQPLFKAVHTRK